MPSPWCRRTADPDELENLWDKLEATDPKRALKKDLLEWLAGSTSWNSGYNAERGAGDAVAIEGGPGPTRGQAPAQKARH